MTQADRMHSMPPTNTPVDTTRRHFLTVAAGGAASAIAAPALPAVSTVDPVFDLIEAHRQAHAAHMASLELQNRLERQHDSRADWVSTKPCHDEADAFEALIAAPAITPQGLLAKLAYLQELASEFETEWMIDELVYPLG